MKAQRLVWGETLAELAATDPTLRVLDGDLATSTRSDLVAAAHPEAFVQVGIAEQNMIGMAVGLSTLGYRPWVSSFSVFLSHRALDQVRMLVSQTKAPVRIGASYSGLLNGSAGKTHQDLADLAIMRALPNMTVLAPADETEARAVTRWASDHDGPVYVRLARDAVNDVFGDDYVFVPGRPLRVRDGDDVTLVSTGVQTSRTVDAAALLAERGIEARIVHVPSIKPLDEDALVDELRDSRHIVTVEEHTVLGGLGTLVATALQTRGVHVPLTVHGLADGWSESAPNEFLLDRYGLSPERVADVVVGALAPARL